MQRRRFLALAAAAPLAGCSNPFGGPESGRLDLTVHNERAAPVAARVTVVDADGTTYEDVSDDISSGTARAFEVTVGTRGRHVATVAGDDWQGQLAWHADTCARYDGTVRVTPDAVEVAGECVQQR